MRWNSEWTSSIPRYAFAFSSSSVSDSVGMSPSPCSTSMSAFSCGCDVVEASSFTCSTKSRLFLLRHGQENPEIGDAHLFALVQKCFRRAACRLYAGSRAVEKRRL